MVEHKYLFARHEKCQMYKIILLWFSFFVCFAWMDYWKTIYKAANLGEFKVENL